MTTIDAFNDQDVFAAIADRSAVLELIRTDRGVKRLADAKDPAGTSALHWVVFNYRDIALELIKDPTGIELLVCTRTSNGASALDWAVRSHVDVASKVRRIQTKCAGSGEAGTLLRT